MFILGISCFYHDAAAALIQNGQIVVAIEEERLTRKKHDYNFPIHAIKYCLDIASIKVTDLDYIVFYEKPFLKFERILKTCLLSFPYSFRLFQQSMTHWLQEKLWIKALIREKLDYQGEILFSEHHYSHAASSFFVSPFEKAVILTVDGVGEWATLTVGIGEGHTITIEKQVNFPHSLGLLYSAFTAFLGFEVNEGEYKVMGLAPYGQPKYIQDIYDLIKLTGDDNFRLDLDFFSYHYTPDKTFSKKFVAKFGQPRNPQEKEIIEPYYADLAASIQNILEEILLKILNSAYKQYGLRQLCLAGGVALNSVANRKILENTPFEQIYIQPQAGDGGAALGAALYLYHSVLGHKRQFVQEHTYYGPQYSESDIKRVLDDHGVRYRQARDENMFKEIVEYLKEGKVIGWFQGRMEWGPRALGNRSILADPRKAEMKDVVNSKVKFRESFRPFAASILADQALDWFEIENIDQNYLLKYMLMVTEVKKEKRNIIPAVTHIDGTTRPQLVYQKDNSRYYKLIEEFYRSTNVPLILNTSLNLRGEPIVCSPEDALSTFQRSGLDILVLNNFLVVK